MPLSQSRQSTLELHSGAARKVVWAEIRRVNHQAMHANERTLSYRIQYGACAFENRQASRLDPLRISVSRLGRDHFDFDEKGVT